LDREKVHLELFSGFRMTVIMTKNGPAIQADTMTKVVRTMTARQLMEEEERKVRSRMRNASARELDMAIQDAVDLALAGSTVMTRYNSRIYRVAGVDWQKNAYESTFELRGKGEMSFMDYYKERWPTTSKYIQKDWGLLIVEDRRRRIKDSADKEEEKRRTIYLIPELCALCGMTDEMRDNHFLGKAIAQKTKLDPGERIDRVGKMIRQLTSGMYTVKKEGRGSSSRKEEKKVAPPLDFRTNPEKIMVQTLGPYEITAEGGDSKERKIPIYRNRNNFNHEMRNIGAKFPSKIQIMCAIICTRRDSRLGGELQNRMRKLSRNMNFDRCFRSRDLAEIIETKNDGPRDFADAASYAVSQGFDVIIALVPPRSNKVIYNAVKQACITKLGVISQCIQSKSLGSKRADVVVGNSLKQIFSKLGAIAWEMSFNDLKLPNGLAVFKQPTMIVGVDTVEKKKLGYTTIGVVGTTNKLFSRTIWSVDKCAGYSPSAVAQLVFGLVKDFCMMNKVGLRQLIIYRQGVSEAHLVRRGGPLSVMEEEVKELQDNIHKFNEQYPQRRLNTKITMCVVQKRIANRFFLCQDAKRFSPFPGTYIPSTSSVCSNELREFYLVPSEAHPNQGTATPTKYTVVVDEVLQPDPAAFNIDRERILASLTYQLCFMYSNWPGSVRVPSVLMQAGKLCTMMTEHVTHREDVPHGNLEKRRGNARKPVMYNKMFL